MDYLPVIVEETFNCPAEKVWQAITDVNEMQRWYFNVIKDFKPLTGFQIKFNISFEGKNYLHVWKVLEVIAGKKLVYEWKYEKYEGHSAVSWELMPAGEKTNFILKHTGIETFPQDNPDFTRESCTAGWNQIIHVNLKNYLEK